MSQTEESTPSGGSATARAGHLVKRTVRRDLRSLKLLEKNARYMKAPVFNQLVANIKRDGCLTSLPLIHNDVVLSGNHRVQAAIKAGVLEEDCIEILGELGDGERVGLLEAERQLSIQLSHNSLTGEDDPNLLASLYESLPLEEKLYSGITDDQLKPPDPLDIASLSAGATQMQEIQLVFLPEDAAVFSAFIEKVTKRAGRAAKAQVMVASLADFGKLFDTIIAVKGAHNIKNTALAFRAICELAELQLAEMAGPDTDEPSA